MFVFCFFKQKTAYELHISEWSSDVGSSDLVGAGKWIGRSSVSVPATEDRNRRRERAPSAGSQSGLTDQSGSRHWMAWCILSPVTTARCPLEWMLTQQIGRASGRESVCQCVKISVSAVSLKQKTNRNK